MAGQEVYISPKPPVDFDDKVFQATVVAAATLTPLVLQDGSGLTFFRTRTGRRARLIFVGNAVQPGGEAAITFHIYVNGNPLMYPPYDRFKQALGETYNGWANVSVDIPLPENAMIQVMADNSDDTSPDEDWIVDARLRVVYEEF